MWRDGKWIGWWTTLVLSSAVFAWNSFYTLRTQHVKAEHFLMKLKFFFPFIRGFMFISTFSSPFLLSSSSSSTSFRLYFAFIEWNFIFMFYQTTIAELLRNTFFFTRCGPNGKAKRIDEKRISFVDRFFSIKFFSSFVLFFSDLKIPCASTRDTFIPWIVRTIVKVK